MKKLHIFMLKSFIGPFVATFFISMFVLIMQFLWRMIDEIVGKGLEFTVIAELLIYVATTLVPMALPLAVLLSSIMTFGSLGENYELIALKSAGISFSTGLWNLWLSWLYASQYSLLSFRTISFRWRTLNFIACFTISGNKTGDVV